MKRILSLLLTAVLLVGAPAAVAAVTTPPSGSHLFADATGTETWYASAELLAQIGVIAGLPDGTFASSAPVTREQFAKMAVAAANEADPDAVRPRSSGFSDVSPTRWSSGYIRTAALLGFLAGMPDGSFHPAEPVSYAQTMTITLRMLGVDTASLDGTWPRNVLDKAASAGLTDGFAYDATDAMTRGDCAILLARLLDTDMEQDDAQGASTSGPVATGITPTGTETFAEHTGLFRTAVVLADNSVDRNLDTQEVRTDIGTLTNVSGTEMAIGSELRLALDGTRVTKVYGSASYHRTFPVEAVVDGTLYYRTGVGTVPLTPTADLDLYDNNGSLLYANLSARVPAGSLVTLAYDSDSTTLRYLQFSLPTENRTGTYTELLVLETALTDDTLAENRMVTNLGTYTLAAGLVTPAPGTRIGAVLNGTVVTSLGSPLHHTEQTTILQAVGTQVLQSRDGVSESRDLPSTATWYHNGTVVPFASIASLIQRDSAIVYEYQPGSTEATTAVLYDPQFGAPQFADQQEIYDLTLGNIDLHDVLLSREGDLIQVYEIKYNDVAYEVTDIWGGNRYVELYQGQAIGIIEAYAPNRFAPAAVQISVYSDDTGKFTSQTFQFSPDFLLASLNSGEFDIGDSVIVLTGRDGKIVRLSR